MSSRPLTLGEAITHYLNRYDNPMTAHSYRQTLSRMLEELPPETALRDITREDLDRVDFALRQRGLADATISSYRRRLKAFFNWLAARDYMASNVADHLRIKRRRISMASKAMPSDVLREMLVLVQRKTRLYAAERDTAILALMVTYGARRGDVARLTLKRINLSEQWIVFRVKGGSDNRLPLPPETAEILGRWLAIRRQLVPTRPHDFVFTRIWEHEEERFQPLSAESISTMIKRLAVEACGRQYGPHSIRHWFGQQQADRGVPATILSSVMGHSGPEITLAHYYNQDWERVKQVLTDSELAKRIRPPAPAQSKILRLDFSA